MNLRRLIATGFLALFASLGVLSGAAVKAQVLVPSVDQFTVQDEFSGTGISLQISVAS
jgi:hypothetical protein